jgi:hypothetical protein
MSTETPFEQELRELFEKLPFDAETTKAVDPALGEVRLINFKILKQIVENYMTAAYTKGLETATSSALVNPY